MAYFMFNRFSEIGFRHRNDTGKKHCLLCADISCSTVNLNQVWLILSNWFACRCLLCVMSFELFQLHNSHYLISSMNTAVMFGNVEWNIGHPPLSSGVVFGQNEVARVVHDRTVDHWGWLPVFCVSIDEVQRSVFVNKWNLEDLFWDSMCALPNGLSFVYLVFCLSNNSICLKVHLYPVRCAGNWFAAWNLIPLVWPVTCILLILFTEMLH